MLDLSFAPLLRRLIATAPLTVWRGPSPWRIGIGLLLVCLPAVSAAAQEAPKPCWEVHVEHDQSKPLLQKDHCPNAGCGGGAGAAKAVAYVPSASTHATMMDQVSGCSVQASADAWATWRVTFLWHCQPDIGRLSALWNLDTFGIIDLIEDDCGARLYSFGEVYYPGIPGPLSRRRVELEMAASTEHLSAISLKVFGLNIHLPDIGGGWHEQTYRQDHPPTHGEDDWICVEEDWWAEVRVYGYVEAFANGSCTPLLWKDRAECTAQGILEAGMIVGPSGLCYDDGK